MSNPSPGIIPILLALLAYTGWGVSDSIGVMLFRKNNPSLVIFYSGLFRAFIWLLFLPFFITSFGSITLIPLLINLIAGLSSGLGYYFYGRAARIINPALVAAITGGWGGTALIFSLLFLREKVSLSQWLSIGLIFVGLFLVTVKLSWFRKLNMKKEIGVLFAFLGLIFWGLCGALLKIPAVSYGWYWTSLIMLFPYIFILLFEVKSIGKKINLKIIDVRIFLLVVFLSVIADLGYNSSFQLGGNVAIVGTIAGSSATFATFLSYLIYKEPLTKKQIVGIIIALLGIVSTAYFSSA